ncbi:hypothetical protein, partial [Halomonas sp. ND22Bw]|uniref:hypothetical protein n=1 Tax=Halomonas sp. ND22Bw TaxID=2054178 RepID=UPI001C62F94E
EYLTLASEHDDEYNEFNKYTRMRLDDLRDGTQKVFNEAILLKGGWLYSEIYTHSNTLDSLLF